MRGQNLLYSPGTNDVGALKHAHVGVAILSHCPEWVEKKQSLLAQLGKEKENKDKDKETSNGATKGSKVGTVTTRPAGRSGPSTVTRRGTGPQAQAMEKQLNQMLKELEEQEKAQIVKLGDASIAAPFSSKLSSIECSTLLLLEIESILVFYPLYYCN
jgi:cation-transporting ATPase 13A1